MPTVAELAGTDKEKQGPGFTSLAEDEKPEPPKISSHLFVGFRLLLPLGMVGVPIHISCGVAFDRETSQSGFVPDAFKSQVQGCLPRF